MRLELKRIDIWSAIKISFCVNIILGFIVGIFYAMFLGLFAGFLSALPGSDEIEGIQMSFGILILVMPFMFAFFIGIIYTVATALCVALYNFLSKFTGGVEFSFQQIAEMQPQPPPSPYGNYYAQPPSYGPPPISPYAPPPQHPEPPRGDKGADL
ncbi:MAG: DUF3566 domain-containing protein [Candidatus Zixiibacteriota bacterium]